MSRLLLRPLALTLLLAGCDSSDDPSDDAPVCAAWWRDGTWSAETRVTDFTQPCRPVDQACAPEPESHGWTYLAEGYSAGGPFGVGSPSMRLDACGQPLLAWFEPFSSYNLGSPNRANVLARRWSGTEWEPLGPQPVFVTGQENAAVSLALDPTGRPVLAAVDGYGALQVAAHNGPGAYTAVRSELMLRPDNPYYSYSVDALRLEVAADGSPIACVRRTTTTSRLGTPPTSYTSYEAYDYGPQTVTSIPPPQGSDMRTLRVDSGGAAWLFHDRQLLRLEDGAWVPSGSLRPEGLLADLRMVDDRPVALLFIDTGLEGHFEAARLLEDGSWAPLWAPLPVAGNFSQAQLRIDPSTGRPVVAFVYYGLVHGEDLYALPVVRWTGAEWELIGGPAVRDGVRGINGLQFELDGAGQPTVAWYEARNAGLHVARFRP